MRRRPAVNKCTCTTSQTDANFIDLQFSLEIGSCSGQRHRLPQAYVKWESGLARCKLSLCGDTIEFLAQPSRSPTWMAASPFIRLDGPPRVSQPV